MSVKVKTVKNRFPKMQSAIKSLNGKTVSAGVMGEHAWLAGIHEYGCRIKVTDKMRGYLHSQGLHLKKETTEIVIPERAFLRSGFDQCEKAVLDAIDGIIGDVVSGQVKEQEFFNAIGLLLKSGIQDAARDLRSPQNHPFTTERKGSSNPLVDTGDMIGAISYEVK